jgi:hypothetical protein
MPAINPRALFQQFLASPKPRAIVTGSSRYYDPVQAQGAGYWVINPSSTFNGNANSVPILMHNIKSASSLKKYPQLDNTVLWFDYPTCAIVGVSTYGSNNSYPLAGSNLAYNDWYIESTKALSMPTTASVSFDTPATIYTSGNVNLTFKRAVRFTGWEDFNPDQVGATFTPTGGVTARAQLKISTVRDAVVLSYAITALVNGAIVGTSSFDFYFNNNGFAFADFPERLLTDNGDGTYSKTDLIMRWTAVSGF